MAETILSIGTNLGNKMQNILRSQDLIVKNTGTIEQESSIFRTHAWGMSGLSEEESIFYNKVIKINTGLSPLDLLNKIQETEAVMGRTRSAQIRYSSRTVDIDILFFDQLILNHERLIIPHPLLHLRRFVLAPLCEIMPDFTHPVFNKTIQTLLEECTDDLLAEKLRD